MVKEEIWLDIGAGKIQDAIRSAQRHANVTYIALDPAYPDTINGLTLPPNLTIRRWSFSKLTPIPFEARSTDKVKAWFIMGELANTGWDDEEIKLSKQWKDHINFVKLRYGEDYPVPLVSPDTQIIYQHLITDIKRVLRPHGILQIVEPQANIEIASIILQRSEFTVGTPKPLPDSQDTEWTRAFRVTSYRPGARRERNSLTLPMELLATF